MQISPSIYLDQATSLLAPLPFLEDNGDADSYYQEYSFYVDTPNPQVKLELAVMVNAEALTDSDHAPSYSPTALTLVKVTVLRMVPIFMSRTSRQSSPATSNQLTRLN